VPKIFSSYAEAKQKAADVAKESSRAVGIIRLSDGTWQIEETKPDALTTNSQKSARIKISVICSWCKGTGLRKGLGCTWCNEQGFVIEWRHPDQQPTKGKYEKSYKGNERVERKDPPSVFVRREKKRRPY